LEVLGAVGLAGSLAGVGALLAGAALAVLSQSGEPAFFWHAVLARRATAQKSAPRALGACFRVEEADRNFVAMSSGLTGFFARDFLDACFGFRARDFVFEIFASFFKFAHAFADSARELRQFLRSEEQ
jgi:hypothetical protein